MTADVAGPIDLAREPDFTLGCVTVRPSRRELVAASQSLILEPRVMQVLVALGQAEGETVCRDVLIARCWDGVIVGEDAIQRCIGRLRKAADTLGGFDIETLSRVGYRLRAEPAVALRGASPLARRGRLLAVLPFDSLSADPDLAYVADGVADEILQAIARRSTVKAIGRTSSFQFRGADKVVAQISEALGATHVLDGSVRRSGARVRVAAHLMDLSDQTMIWSDRFDGASDDLFSLQEAVAGAVVAALDGAFVRPMARNNREARTHDLILRLSSWTGPPGADVLGDRMRMMADLEQLAGDDGEAWGRIAAAYAAIRWVVPRSQEADVRTKALAAAQRALGLDPTNGGAHKAFYLLQPPVGKFVAQEERLIAARDAAPDDGEIHWSLYTHFLSVGRLSASFAEAETAYRVDPLRPTNVMAYANALFTAGCEAQALALMRHALDRWPLDPIVFAIAVWTAASAGEYAFVDQVMAQDHGGRFDAGAQGLIARARFAIDALRAPSADKCAATIEHLRMELRQGPPHFSLIGLAAALGADLDTLYDLVDAADFEPLKRVDSMLPPLDGPVHLFLRVNACLRQSPRFVHLCDRLGLVAYWRQTNVWPDCVEETADRYDFKAIAVGL